MVDEDSGLSPIVMVDRGDCTFVTKVRNIEKLGVKLAIIADNRDEHSEELIMADDGTGHSINIPSFIIRKKDAKHIKDMLTGKNKQTVYVKANLEIVHPDNRVEYDFYYSSVLDIEYWRLADIAKYQAVLGNDALFTPRILTYSCKACSEETKRKNCYSRGEYCPYMPKLELTNDTLGITEM